MASSKEFVDFVCEQISELGDIRYRKMFGEYMVYYKDKPVLMVCDDTVYIKQLECVKEHMKDAQIGVPYEGSKQHYILDIDDAEFAKMIVKILEPEIPVPKKRGKKI